MVGSGRVGPGRAGPGWAGSSRKWVLYMKTNFFCSMDYVPKINTKRDNHCCELLYVTAEGVKLLNVQLYLHFLQHTR